jgi:methionine biosynthesis protein MetW
MSQEESPSRPLSLRELLKAARPPTNRLYEDIVDSYEDYHAHTDTGKVERAQLIASWIDPGSRVLDAGCGDGIVAEFLKRHRRVEIEGIDFAQTAVAKTRARGIPATIQDLDVEPNLPSGFDYIMFIEVLEHLRFPHRVLRTAVERARRAVLVTIPNTGWLGYRLQVLGGHSPVQSYTHLHMWSHRDFLGFCQRLGLPSPELRFFASGSLLRTALLRRWPNLFAYQLAYRISALGT